MKTVLGARSGTAYGDGWARSTCTICMNRCGILAHVNDDGVFDKILGDPDNPHNAGRTCAKGDAGFEGLTDVDRITTPLRRTNPTKGVGVDPGWVPISWDEALDEIAGHLRRTIADYPEKILYTSFDIFHLRGALAAPWVTGLGMPGYSTGSAAIFCGNSVHGIAYMNQNAFEGTPDPTYSRYILNFAAQFGSVVHYDTMHATHELSVRRSDVKLVSIDPVCSSAAAVADEWVPIRPGTDAALILGMVDQLLNELGIYDREFPRNFTNAAYLVGPGRMMLLAALTAALLVTMVVHLSTRTDAPGKKESLDRLLRGQYRSLFGGLVVGAGTAVPVVLALAGAAAAGPRDVLAVICCLLLVDSGFWLRLLTLRVGIFPPVHIPSVHRPQSSGSLAGG